MHPTYYSLLFRQKAHKGRTGLTIPFLVGALRKPEDPIPANKDDVLAELNFLLETMRDGPSDKYCVRIGKCVNLQQPVAALYDVNSVMGVSEAIKSRHGHYTLYVEKIYFPQRKAGVMSVANCLCELVGEQILARNFSFRNGRYGAFDKDDLLFINAAAVE